MASIITATTTSGLTQSADNSGVLQLASGTGNLVTIPSVTGTAMVSGNMPAFSVYRTTSDQSVTSGVATKIQFNAERFDTANCFDSTTNYRFTPNVAGYYQISCSLTSNGTSISVVAATIYKNGSENTRLQYSPNNAAVSGSTLIYMNGTTDYIEFYGVVTASSGASFYAGEVYTHATGCLVRSA